MVSLVNSYSNATSRRWHLWEVDLRFAPGLPPGWETNSLVGRGGKAYLLQVEGSATVKVISYTLHPTPYALHPTPYTLHPTPYTLHPTPYTLCRTPYTLHPTPYTLHPTPYTLHSTPDTLHPTLCT